MEEALCDSLAMRSFVGIDLGREAVPDETTACKFRHLLERHELGRQLFEQVHRYLEAHGLKIAKGTIMDATIINAPSSSLPFGKFAKRECPFSSGYLKLAPPGPSGAGGHYRPWPVPMAAGARVAATMPPRSTIEVAQALTGKGEASGAE